MKDTHELHFCWRGKLEHFTYPAPSRTVSRSNLRLLELLGLDELSKRSLTERVNEPAALCDNAVIPELV